MAATADMTAAFKPTAEFLERYELGELLGKGGFGAVYSCFDRRTGNRVACKVLNRAHVRNNIGVEPSKEVGIMKELAEQHSGVIQLLDSIEDETNMYVVMEYCAGTSLLDILKKNGAMPERSARVVIGQVAAGLAFCHSKRVLHLDVKPENIFFLESPIDALYGSGFASSPTLSSLYSSLEVRARLADFGMATVLKPGRKVRGDVGSPHFKAPEIVSGQKFGLEVDVWALGVVLSVMLTGTVPFLGTSNHDKEGLNKAIIAGEVNFNSARWWNVSPQAKDLVKRMLQVDPTKRITAAEILEHPWFTVEQPCTADDEEILPAFAVKELGSAKNLFASPQGAPVASSPKAPKTPSPRAAYSIPAPTCTSRRPSVRSMKKLPQSFLSSKVSYAPAALACAPLRSFAVL